MGHEGGGEVVETGPKVRDIKPGDFVMSMEWTSCMADYWTAREEAVMRKPAELSDDIASLGEPIACAVFAGMDSGVELGDVVAISGVGFAGLIILQVVRAKGAHKVMAVDVAPDKLALATQLGADVTLNPSKDDVVAGALEETGGRGVDVAIETAGVSESFNALSAALKAGGVLGIYSWVTRSLPLQIDRWHDDGFDLRVLALMHRRLDRRYWIERSLLPVAQGTVGVASLITHRFRLDDASRAFDVASNDPSAVKVALMPSLPGIS